MSSNYLSTIADLSVFLISDDPLNSPTDEPDEPGGALELLHEGVQRGGKHAVVGVDADQRDPLHPRVPQDAPQVGVTQAGVVLRRPAPLLCSET